MGRRGGTLMCSFIVSRLVVVSGCMLATGSHFGGGLKLPSCLNPSGGCVKWSWDVARGMAPSAPLPSTMKGAPPRFGRMGVRGLA